MPADARKLAVDVIARHRAAREDAEEAMAPRAVVADVVGQQAVDEPQLAGPDLGRVRPTALRAPEVTQRPLPVRPGVVVFRVDGERRRGEAELARWGVEGEHDRATVLPASERGSRSLNAPDLVALEVLLDQLVEQVQLLVEVGLDRQQDLGTVRPAQSAADRGALAHQTE